MVLQFWKKLTRSVAVREHRVGGSSVDKQAVRLIRREIVPLSFEAVVIWGIEVKLLSQRFLKRIEENAFAASLNALS